MKNRTFFGKRVLLLFIAFLLTTVNAYADGLQFGLVYMSGYEESPVGYVYGSTNLTGDIVIPSTFTITHEDGSVTTHTVRRIEGLYGFKNCTGITSIVIPNTVDYIVDGAFENCTNLTSVTLPQSLNVIRSKTFKGCSSLTTINIPNTISQIEKEAFMGCSSLQSIVFPSSLWLLGSWNYNTDAIWSGPANVFKNCTSLTSVVFGNNSNNNLYITSHCFENCTSLTNIVLPTQGPYYIWDYAFKGCTSLTEISIYGQLQGLYVGAFDSCINLTTINYNVVNCIGGGVSNCPNINTLNIGDSVLYLPVFSGLTGLTSITIPKNVEEIATNAFVGCTNIDTVYFNADSCTQCFWGLTSTSRIIFGNNVKMIPNGICNNSSVTSVIIPDSVVTIGKFAFSECTGLNTIVIPNSVRYILPGAFKGCSNLDTITIGSSVEDIGVNAFVLRGSEVINVLRETPPRLHKHNCYGGEAGNFAWSFGSLGNMNSRPMGTVNIPCGTYEAYNSICDSNLNNSCDGCILWNKVGILSDPLNIVTINTSEHGSATIIESPTCENSTAIISAIADSGYLFSHWSDGDTTNPRTLILTSDTSLTAYFIVAPTDCNNISLPYAADFTQCWTTEGGASVIASNRIRLGGHGQKATSPWFTIHDSAGLHLKWTLTKDSVNGTVPENDPNFIRKIKVLADDNIRTMQWDNWWGNTISMSEALGAQYAGQTIQVEFEYIGNDSISFSLTDVTLFQFADTVEVSAPIHAYIGDTIVLAAHVSLPEGNYGPYVPYWNFYTSDWTSVSNNSIGVVNNHADTVVAIFNTPGEYIATFAYTVWNVFNGYPVYSNNREVYISIIDTTVVDTLFDCDSITLPYIADFTQCWTASGGATIIGGNQASINSQGQTLTSPWINVPAGTVYYHFIDRRDTTGAYWNSWDSAVWYSVSIEDADGGIITTANWDSETSSQGKISHFMASGGPIRFVFTYTDTHAVQLHYIENLEIYAYDMSLTVEGPTSVNVGDTVVYVAHVSMPEGDYPDNWYWCLYNQYYSMVDSTNATIIATTDSTRTIVWHASGNYQLFAEVKKYIPQMVWQYLYYNITVLDTTPPTPVDCDSITLPYTADFTQCWTAEGAVVIDPNHVSMISVGQKITSPWMESYPGKTFLHWDQQREGTLDYNSEQFTITIESETGVIASWLEYAADWSLTSTFTSPGGRIRVTFEYTGSNPVPSYQITGVNLYQYEIENTIEAPVIAHVGDTVMFTAHATLQNGETPDYYEWNMYDSFGNWMNEDDSARTIISRTDSTLLVVWNSHGRYQVSCDINKYNVYNDAYGSYSAYAHAYQNINIVDHDFFEADSIYYISAAMDTVIGCHPDLHVANLPESVTVIFDSAFFNLSNLSIIELPTSLHTIGNMAFAWNQGISEITIPQNVTFVGDNAFWWDTNLTTVNFNATNCQTMSPSTDENGNYWPVFIECDKITTINIGENVTRIPDRAFSYCSGLHGTLTIPDAVTYIGRSAFYHWINGWDWENGSSWDTLSIVLGTGLTEIGDYAFGCPRAHITSVISHNPEPPIIGEQTFYRYEPEYTPRLQVPCGSAAAYRNAQHWSRIEEIIEDCDGIEDAENDARTPAILSDNGIITVVGATELVSVYDMMGRLVSAYMPTDFRCTIVVPHSGVYMVKIGDCPARKIVVIK